LIVILLGRALTNKKKIVFLTGTRADFGKLKSLINISKKSKLFDVHIFVTGMHLDKKFGYTIDEVQKEGYDNIFPYKNYKLSSKMDQILANTIKGFSNYISDIKPDLIIVHGDRVEALAGAISGSLNNILVAHIEGGEVSGTVDELIRHAVSKMSHIHFVSNKDAAKRLNQLGELGSCIHIIGSPDLDLMDPKRIPKLDFVLKYYDINFDDFAIAMFHPVTTEFDAMAKNTKSFVNTLIKSKKNYIVIYPNNDLGSNIIINEYRRLKNKSNFRIFPSIRFEYFLTLLHSAEFIIGNSSAGIREAPYYNTPSIDIGTRQKNRSAGASIFHCDYRESSIIDANQKINGFSQKNRKNATHNFGSGDSDKKFIQIIKRDLFWKTNKQKQFQDK
jgi:UDP-N-acetylglucosamine 2-epimerase (hydrolysing)